MEEINEFIRSHLNLVRLEYGQYRVLFALCLFSHFYLVFLYPVSGQEASWLYKGV